MVDACIRCKERRPGATPSLCLPCFRYVSSQCFFFFKDTNNMDEERFEAALKNWRNRTQRRIRKAWKRHQPAAL